LTAAVHGVLANIGLGLPHLATVHDPLRPEQFPGLRGRLKHWVLGRAVNRLDTIIFPGEDVRANFVDFLPPRSRSRCRLVTIPNGINAAHYATRPPGTDLRRRLALRPGTCLMGFLGRFMEQKGFLPLLDALRQLAAGAPRPFHLVAVGSGDRQREYARGVEERGLASMVTLLEFMPDIQPVLSQFDLLVVPSLWEASPLVPMEAMVAGVPVLGTDCIGLREVLTGSPSRMVRTGDVDDLCRGLADALANPWTSEARAYAPAACVRFDNTRSARLLVELFGQTLSQRAGRR
jgi:glycosyltransferase involved in cell wall biosynthesis